MSDQTTCLIELRRQMRQFVDERQWQQFHSPKSLAMSVAIEAAELMEHFQWLTIEQSQQVASDPRRLEGVREEIADVLCYVLALANVMDIDLTTAFESKMVKNAEKYPVDRFRGRYGEDDVR